MSRRIGRAPELDALDAGLARAAKVEVLPRGAWQRAFLDAAFDAIKLIEVPGHEPVNPITITELCESLLATPGPHAIDAAYCLGGVPAMEALALERLVCMVER